MEQYFENEIEGIGFASPRISKILNFDDTKCPRNLKFYHSVVLLWFFAHCLNAIHSEGHH